MGIKQLLKNNKWIKRQYINYYGIQHIINGTKITQLNQSVESRILQISHRLERGICLNITNNYKMNWGFNKANELIDLLEKQRKIEVNDVLKIGQAVLSSFINSKEEADYPDERIELQSLKEKARKYSVNLQLNPEWGGIVEIKKKDIVAMDMTKIGAIFNRHSCRDFSKVPVSEEEIQQAVELAWKAPSSCNRQASDIYVLDAKDRESITGENNMGADKYLVVCGKIDSFSIDEIDDWIVSTSIFCGYLSMALHVLGIGSVFLRKEIIKKDHYNDAVKSLCNIPDTQQIIIELAIGHYPDVLYVPISKRRSVEEILHFKV